MSDEDFEQDDSSNDGDFSASEDEWKPNEAANEIDSSEIESDGGNDDLIPDKKKKIASMSKTTIKRKASFQSLRAKMFNKYKPPPKALNSSKSDLSTKFANILEKSEYKKNQSSSSLQNVQDSDSESSGDDYLVNPNELDLKSSFFDVTKDKENNIEEFKKSSSPSPPKFDCNAGMEISNSEDDDDEGNLEIVEQNEETGDENSEDICKIEEKSSEKKFNFNKLHEYSKNLENAKIHLQKLQNKSIAQPKENDIDVSKLLALGESSKITDEKLTKKRKKPIADSDSDWEEVKDAKEHQSPSTKDEIQVTVQLQQHIPRDKKSIDVEAMFKRKLNRIIKENQIYFHKVSLLCHIAHGIYTNKVLNSPVLMTAALKLLPNNGCYPDGRTEINYFESMVRWYKTVISIKRNQMYSGIERRPKLLMSLGLQIKYKEAICKKDYVLIFIILLRAMGIQCRMIMNMVTLPLKPSQTELCSLKMKKDTDSKQNKSKIEPASTSKTNKSSEKKEKTKNIPSTKHTEKRLLTVKTNSDDKPGKVRENLPANEKKKLQSKKEEKDVISPLFLKKSVNVKQTEEKIPLKKPLTRSQKRNIPQLDGGDDAFASTSRRKDKANVQRKRSIESKKSQKSAPMPNSDEDFEPSPPKRIKSTNKHVDRRILSTDIECENDNEKRRMDVWVEVYAENEDQWITLDLFKCKVYCVDDIRKSATPPIAYVLAWNNDNTLKDVSARYCPQWNTVTRKLRVEQDWLDEAIHRLRGRKTARDIAEDRELHKIHLDKPLPTTISEYKNHPLYVIERHLLKFEAIYPENAVTLGFVRGEPVYARECVRTLHSRDIWLKSARVVKPGEKPYKIVKARPKWDKYTSTVIKDQPLEIYGYWQTMDYEPPTAENGIVPRNAYGNVELFKKCMLPKKTVHLQLPGLNRVCKKLKIDCAPAVIGFDFHQGLCHPMLDGFVVCEEYAELVTQAWYKDQEEAEKREEEKYQQRVYGNWKRLIRGLLIGEKLKKKYNFKTLKPEPESKAPKSRSRSAKK